VQKFLCKTDTYIGKGDHKNMAYSALEVAKYVINHEHNNGREISNLRLQKLLYFVQAKVLVETENPCFEEEMEAWDFGPVVPCVYHTYKIFGSWDLSFSGAVPSIAEVISEKIDSIIDYCQSFPTRQLVEITHNQDPWKNVYKRGQKNKISNDSIKDYFLSHGSKQQ